MEIERGARVLTMHQKMNLVFYFHYNLCSQKDSLEERNSSKFDHSLAFIFSTPQKNLKFFIITTFLCHGPLPFST